MEYASEGLLLRPKQIDHAQEVEQRLEAIGVPFTREGASIRITGYVRNSNAI